MAKKKKKSARKKSKSAFKLKLKEATKYSIAQVTFFSLAALVVISFTRQGIVLEYVYNFIDSNFGWTKVFLPFVFLTFGLYLSKFRSVLSQANVLVGSLLTFISITSLTRSGIIGATAWDGLVELISTAGAFVVYIVLSIIGIVILFNTSIDQIALLMAQGFRQYIFRNRPQISFGSSASKTFRSGDKKEFKVVGDPSDDNIQQDKERKDIEIKGGDNKRREVEAQKIAESDEPLEQKLVSNVRGEEKIWKYPPLDILSSSQSGEADRGDIKGNAAVIEETLDSFGISARVVEVNLGPAVTQYALEVALGTKLSKITSLERDLALALAAPTGTIRIEAPIPGRSLIGIELPNRSLEYVSLKRMMTSDVMKNTKSKLAIALGLDVSGQPVVADLGKMPHILIAGQTGSGKSVCINTFLSTILLRTSPQEIKLILVDPKRVELTGYNGIPHLLSPVIVEPEKVVSALRWVLTEMDRRYKQFAKAGARNIESFNEMAGFQALPYIVVVIDELADIMLFSPTEVEDSITRIAQMSRATGIHMILATQRPSVDVITGLIKANIPARIAFAVSSQVDSRVILDGQGAEKLLGRGDMLYLPPDQAKPRRTQGAYVDDKDINALVSFIKNQGVEPQYTDEVTSMAKPGTTKIAGVDEDLDGLFSDAVAVVCQYDRASASLLQRRLSVGYARAARILDQLHALGVVSEPDGSKARDVLVKNPQEFLDNLKASAGSDQ